MQGGPDPATISLEEFNSIQTGMTYEQVKEIIGSDGELISDVNLGTGEVIHKHSENRMLFHSVMLKINSGAI